MTEHIIPLTTEEWTVVACALEAHQKYVDGLMGIRLTHVHTRVMDKLRVYFNGINDPKQERSAAKYAPSCRRCNDRGVIETGNNDLPCDCPAGDMQLFNTERGTETGAEIKARRR